MDRIQNSAVDEDPPPPYHQSPLQTTKMHANGEPSAPHNKYSREANEANSRQKRATKPKEDNRNTCSLFIQTDPLIWRHISESVRFV